MPDLSPFAENVWVVDGPPVRDMGVMFTTRMGVVKLSDGSLWVNSPVSVPFDRLKRIPEMGPVRYLLAATPRHVWRCAVAPSRSIRRRPRANGARKRKLELFAFIVCQLPRSPFLDTSG